MYYIFRNIIIIFVSSVVCVILMFLGSLQNSGNMASKCFHFRASAGCHSLLSSLVWSLDAFQDINWVSSGLLNIQHKWPIMGRYHTNMQQFSTACNLLRPREMSSWPPSSLAHPRLPCRSHPCDTCHSCCIDSCCSADSSPSSHIGCPGIWYGG